MNNKTEQDIDKLLLQTFSSIYSRIIPMFKAYRSKIHDIAIEKKADKTLLTEADISIQNAIIDIIVSCGLAANIIAEEKNALNKFDCSHEYTWIIDPIDGTAQFVNPNSIEFCSAICLLKNGYPIAATIILPEVLIKNDPIQITCLARKNLFFVNDVEFLPTARNSYNVSITRSQGTEPYSLENELKLKYIVKNSTTSQSLDLLRTAIDLSCFNFEPHFNLFYRKNQKIWDGAPGICFNLAMGNVAIDSNQKSIIPYSINLLSEQSPTSDVVIVCSESFIYKYKELF